MAGIYYTKAGSCLLLIVLNFYQLKKKEIVTWSEQRVLNSLIQYLYKIVIRSHPKAIKKCL